MFKVNVVGSYFSVVFFFALLAPFLHVFKVIHVDYLVGALSFYIGLPLVVVLTWVCVFRSSMKGMLPVSSMFFFFLLVYGVLVSFFVGGDYVDIAGNSTRLLFCIGVICLAVFQRDECIRFLAGNERLLASLALIVLSVSVVLMYFAAAAGYSVYFGLQSTVAFIPLAYGLVNRRWRFVVLSLVLIVASGKRGGMLGAFFVIFVYVGYLVFVGRIKLFLLLLALFVSFALAVYFFDLVPESILARFSQFASDGPIDWDRATAGRFTEVKAVFDVLDRSPYVLIFGSGLGAVIEVGGVEDSTVHFSPFGLMIAFGLPLTLIIYFFMFSVFARGIACSIVSGVVKGRHVMMWTLVFVGEFFFSFTAFTILQSYILWMSVLAIISFSGKGGRVDRA